MVTRLTRGQIWWADLGRPWGSAPAKRRPVLIISSDRFNDSAIATVTVASITSNLRLADAPGNVALSSGQSGLDRDSVINVSQIATLDKAVLTDEVASLDRELMNAVDAGLGLALGLR